jgi:FkbM family methyltransferase
MTYADRSTFLASHFSLKHRIVAHVSRLFEGRTYTMRHGLAAGLKRKGGLGFAPAWLAGRSDETAETLFLRALDFSGKVVYDIGGFEGLMTMFFAQRSRAVVVYEPNPTSRRRLEENVRLNSLTNVIVRPVAAGSAADALDLVFDPLMAGAATASTTIAAQIQTTSRRAHVESVRVIPVDDDVTQENLPRPDFVKIDVEGMELEALRGMRALLRRDAPDLYIEVHGATATEKRANVRAILEELVATGYSNVVHVESGLQVTPASASVAAEGHLFCRCDSHSQD